MRQSTVSKKWKNSAVEKGEGSTSHSKHRKGQKEIKFYSINWIFDTFVLFPAIIMQYLSDLV